MLVCILSQERVEGEKAGTKEEREEGKTFLNIMCEFLPIKRFSCSLKPGVGFS